MWQAMKIKGVLLSLSLCAAMTLPAWAAGTNTAFPGTLNYVEGQASIGNEGLSEKSIGAVDLGPGQSVMTKDGKAEVLLTPGVFFRLGENSSATMVSPDLTNTQMALNHGEAMLEVDELHPENDIRITEDGASTRLLKTGLYDFDATTGHVRVFSGKAKVFADDRDVTVKAGQELALATPGKLKAKGFDKDAYAKNDELYRWSSLRSDYLAEANVNTARTYLVGGWYGPGWWGAGWYWSPWFGAYTFLPADGLLYDPFGWGFYSPLWVRYAPVYGYGNYYHDFAHFTPESVARAGARANALYGPGFDRGAVRSFAPGQLRSGFPGSTLHAGSFDRGFNGIHGGSFGFHGMMGGGFSGHR
jgi:hypothetical protein